MSEENKQSEESKEKKLKDITSKLEDEGMKVFQGTKGLDQLTDQLKSQEIDKMFALKAAILETESNDPLYSEKMMSKVENHYKNSIVVQVIKMIEQLHLHQPYGFVSESKTTCVGKTRYAFIMASCQEEWDHKMKQVIDSTVGKQLPTRLEMMSKVIDKADHLVHRKPDKPKDKGTKIPVRDG